MFDKKCHVCGATYQVQARTGLKQGRCINCRRAKRCEEARAAYAKGKSWSKKEPELARQSWRKYRDANRERNLWYKARRRAEERGLEFNIETSDILIPECCPVFGVRFETERAGGMQSNWCATLDRLNPALGYVKGNVWVISWKANKLKSNASLQDLETLVNALKGVSLGRVA